MTSSSHEKLLRTLFALARGCHAPVDPAVVMDGILDCLLDIVGAERGFILVAPAVAPGRSEEDGSAAGLVPCASRQVDYASGGLWSKSVVKWVLRHKQALLVPDTSTDGRFAGQESVVASAVRSILAAPLLRDGNPVGAIYLDVPVARGRFEDADRAVIEGAAEHVMAAIANARERERLTTRAARLEAVVAQEVDRTFDAREIVGSGPAISALKAAVARVAPTPTTVLIAGESGTGKELVARALHAQSDRAGGPFVALSAAALAPGVLESELFGHEKGAFSGAAARHVGRFELADGGTLFLDEIGELDPAVQVKLLRVLQERVIERVGSATPRRVDVRLVCATHADLAARVAEGRFRQDLFYRLAVFPLTVPPLRERREDVPALAEHFRRTLAPRIGRAVSGFAPDALERLQAHDWPGNVRELRNAVERALVIEEGGVIRAESLPVPGRGTTTNTATGAGAAGPAGLAAEVAAGPLAAARDAFERSFILASLRRHAGNVTQAAVELDIPRSTIYRKLRGWGIAVPSEE